MILTDSSFLVAFFNENDNQHLRAIGDMKKYDEEKQEFLVTEHILGETATVLLYRNGVVAAKEFLDFAQEKCTVQRWESEDMHATLKRFKEQKYEISYIDASIVYLAKFLHLPVACYDENILKEINDPHPRGVGYSRPRTRLV